METALARFEAVMNRLPDEDVKHSPDKLVKYVDDGKIILTESKVKGQVIVASTQRPRRMYSYCYNTGRWRTHSSKWYRSKSTEDFVERFVLPEPEYKPIIDRK